MSELRSAFYRFLELPKSFILKHDTLARKVAISGFSGPTCYDLKNLVCHQNSLHTLNIEATAVEIEDKLKEHSLCESPDDFPRKLYLNYCSHRHFTLLSHKIPFQTPSIQSLADSGFYFCPDAMVIKCNYCDVEIADWPMKKSAHTLHTLASPSCPKISYKQYLGDVGFKKDLNHRFSGVVVETRMNGIF
jgi:Inhibitor of Apoptosis domain